VHNPEGTDQLVVGQPREPGILACLRRCGLRRHPLILAYSVPEPTPTARRFCASFLNSLDFELARRYV